jgi:hypothetical protein
LIGQLRSFRASAVLRGIERRWHFQQSPYPQLQPWGSECPASCLAHGIERCHAAPFDSPTANRIVLTRKKRRPADPHGHRTWTCRIAFRLSKSSTRLGDSGGSRAAEDTLNRGKWIMRLNFDSAHCLTVASMCDNTKDAHLILRLLLSALGSEFLRQEVTRPRGRRMKFRLTVHTTDDWRLAGNEFCAQGVFAFSEDHRIAVCCILTEPWRG